MANEDRYYICWLGVQTCCATDCRNKSGPPHHPRHDVGMGMRAHDHRAVPLCPECHESIHRLTWGTFKGWTRDMVREFMDKKAMKYRKLYTSIEQRRMKCE